MRTPSSLRPFLLILALGLSFTPLAAQTPRAEAARSFAAGEFEAAREQALRAISAGTADAEVFQILCRSLLALNRPADAENYALKAAAQFNDPRFSSVLGEAAFAQGHNREALRSFQDYLSVLPEGVEAGRAYYFCGEIYIRLARYSHADISFTAALQHAPGNARWWARLGWAREKAGESTPALRAYEEALRLDPRLDEALLGAARVKARRRN